MSLFSRTQIEPRLSGWQRSMLAMLALMWATPLGVACWLAPDGRGLGTHQQLGLPPCTMRALWDLRCPSCGMTTSWAHAVRGQWPSAFRANAGGALLAAVSMLGCTWLVATATRGRWWLTPPTDALLLSVGGLVIVITLIDWACRLHAP